MLKIERLSGLRHEFSFLSHTEEFDAFYTRFLQSDLGKIHCAMP